MFVGHNRLLQLRSVLVGITTVLTLITASLFSISSLAQRVERVEVINRTGNILMTITTANQGTLASPTLFAYEIFDLNPNDIFMRWFSDSNTGSVLTHIKTVQPNGMTIQGFQSHFGGRNSSLPGGGRTYLFDMFGVDVILETELIPFSGGSANGTPGTPFKFFLNLASVAVSVPAGGGSYNRPPTIAASPENIRKARHMIDAATGTTVSGHSLLLKDVAEMLEQGRQIQAAKRLIQEPGFLHNTIFSMAMPWSNNDQAKTGVLTDTVATVIGMVRDDVDFRQLLTGDFVYRAGSSNVTNRVTGSSVTNQLGQAAVYESNDHYFNLDRNFVNLGTALQSVSQRMVNPGGGNQTVASPLAAGIFSTRALGSELWTAGTNRRWVKHTIETLFCMPFDALRDSTISDMRVRQDVQRTNAVQFVNECKTCHSVIDPIAGAFSKVDFFDAGNSQGFLKHISLYTNMTQQEANQNRTNFVGENGLARKVIKNATFITGYQQSDEEWEIPAPTAQILGVNGATSGNGPASLMASLAGSDQFAKCMVRRFANAVWRRDPTEVEEPIIDSLTTEFIANEYKPQRVFELLLNLGPAQGELE